MVIVDKVTNKVVKEFHTYVRPSGDPNITEHATKVTGITNKTINSLDQNGKPLPSMEEALEKLHYFLRDNKILEKGFVPVTFGDDDGLLITVEGMRK